MAALWIGVAVFYVWPGAPHATKEYFGDNLLSLVFLPVTILSILMGTRALPARNERRFWHLVAGAFLIWFLYGAIAFFIPDEDWSIAWGVAADCAYVGFYLLFLLAIELKPHLQTMDRLEARQRRLRSTALTCLLFGWLCYLVVIPAAVDRVTYETDLPSFLLYLTLDAFLTVRLLMVRRDSWSVRWAALYGLLALAMVWMFTADLLETIFVGGIFPIGSGTPLDLWWTVPFVLITAAARARHVPFEAGQTVLNQDWNPAQRVPTDQLLMAGAILLPILHHALYAMGLLPPESEGYRQVLVQIILIVLAVLAIAAFRLVESERRGVEAREQALRKELD